MENFKTSDRKTCRGRMGEHKDSHTGQTNVCLVLNLASERDDEIVKMENSEESFLVCAPLFQ